jgi:hypothetical protein
MSRPTITQANGTFWLTCRAEIDIQAGQESVWDILTDADAYSRWNSTISRVEGQIREGERLRLHVPGTSRTFAPTVRDVVPAVGMSWVGGFAPLFKGVRTFNLSRARPGWTTFAMEERFSGLLIPLVKGSMPDFGPIFASFATDLQHAAERQLAPSAT